MSRHEESDPTGGALQRARRLAYGSEGFVDQQGFMLAGDILTLARRASVSPGVTVLDLCCGRGGPGRLITGELGCAYLGVDADPGAVRVARERVGDLGCRYDTRRVPPVPPGRFDVVLLLETMLAFADKEALLLDVAAALAPGGRFAFTVEEGDPLTDTERESMPAADTVWPIPLPRLLTLLEEAGLEVTWQEHSQSHLAVVDSLLAAIGADETAIVAEVGRDTVDEMLTSHRLWGEWLRSGRIRKFSVVTRRTRAEGGNPRPQSRQRSESA